MSNITEMKNLLRSGYDLLYVVSHEEERVVADLNKIASSMNMALCTWSFASGIKMLQGSLSLAVEKVSSNGKKESQVTKVEDGSLAGQPVRILTAIRECKENTVFVLYDYHSYFKDAEIVRELKDALAKIKSFYTPIIIVSPVLKVPVEIEKAATVLDYSLPSRDEITSLVTAIVEQVKAEKPEFNLDSNAKEDVIRACQGLTLKEIDNVIIHSLIEDGTIDPRAVLRQKKQVVKKSGILEYYEASETISDVGGMDLLKDWLRKRRCAFMEEAKKFGLPTPKGILLLGIPGCGKSMISKAIAQAWNMPLLKFDVGAVMQGIVGSSEENMRKVIQTAVASAPCVLWLDEMEKGFSGIASSNFSDSGTTARVFSTFLTWLSEKKDQVFVVATANDVSQLPPELLRKGRFDEVFFVDLPNVEEREEIFRIHLTRLGRDTSKFNLSALAEQSEGFSGADIKGAIESALFDVYTQDLGRVDVCDLNILKAIRETVPLSKMMAPQIQKIKEWCSTNRARMASSQTGGN